MGIFSAVKKSILCAENDVCSLLPGLIKGNKVISNKLGNELHSWNSDTFKFFSEDNPDEHLNCIVHKITGNL